MIQLLLKSNVQIASDEAILCYDFYPRLDLMDMQTEDNCYPLDFEHSKYKEWTNEAGAFCQGMVHKFTELAHGYIRKTVPNN